MYTLLMSVLICCLIQALPVMAAPASKTLKLAHNHNRSHPVHTAMKYMGERVRELSGGALRIRIYSGGVLGPQRENIEQLQLGALDMAKTSASELESFDPVYRVFSFPYLFRDQRHLHGVVRGKLGRSILEGSSSRGFRGLTFYESGARHFYAKKVIHSASDLQGLKVRVQPSRTLLQMVQQMGGLPSPINYGELYTALQQGVVDAAENNLTSFVVSRHGEAARFFSWSGHTMIPDVLMVSTESWKALSAEQQVILQQAATESSGEMVKLWDEAQRKNLELAKKSGITFVEPDRDSFVKAVQPMYRQLQKDNPKLYSLVERIRKEEG
ncbi:MAG: TRAP transporter substrate-binding protein [Endozoicomonas sp.]